MEVDINKDVVVWELYGLNGKKDKSIFNTMVSLIKTNLDKSNNIFLLVMDSNISSEKHKLDSN
jgi:hypothetical protein